MRAYFLFIFILVLAIFASPVLALEKTPARVTDLDDGARRGACPSGWWESFTTTITYYNICTGWVWVWSDWEAGETVGVNFDYLGLCPDINALCTSWAVIYSGAPSGYGFTGTITVRGGSDCSAPVLASQPYLPTSGSIETVWGGVFVPQEFSIQIEWAAPDGLRNPTNLASDHPAAGAFGPAACGTCYPTTRVSNSRLFGVDGEHCPNGITLFDGTCDVEFLIDVQLENCAIVDLEGRSWGEIKALYR